MNNNKSKNETIERSVDLSVGILVILLNIIEIIIIAKLKRKKRNYEICLLSLCCSDLLFGFSNSLVSILYLSNSRRYETVTEMAYSIYLLVALSSILHLSGIALERLWIITKPFQHRVFITRKRIYIILALIWVITIVITASIYTAGELKEDDEEPTSTLPTKRTITATRVTTTSSTNTRAGNKIETVILKDNLKSIVQLTVAIIIIMADVILVTCYGAMIYMLQVKTKINKITAKKEDRVSVVCIFIAAAFVVFTLPYAIAVLKNGVAGFGPNLVLLINSGMNCIVYFFRTKCERYMEKKYNEEASTMISNTPNLQTKNNETEIQQMEHKT